MMRQREENPSDKMNEESPEKKARLEEQQHLEEKQMDQETFFLLACVKNLKKAVANRDQPDTDNLSHEHLEAQRILKWMIEYDRAKRVTPQDIRWQYVGITPKCRELLKSWGIETEKSRCTSTDWWDLRLVDSNPSEIKENLA